MKASNHPAGVSVWGLGFGVYGLGFMVEGAGLRVQDLRFGVGDFKTCDEKGWGGDVAAQFVPRRKEQHTLPCPYQ